MYSKCSGYMPQIVRKQATSSPSATTPALSSVPVEAATTPKTAPPAEPITYTDSTQNSYGSTYSSMPYMPDAITADTPLAPIPSYNALVPAHSPASLNTNMPATANQDSSPAGPIHAPSYTMQQTPGSFYPGRQVPMMANPTQQMPMQQMPMMANPAQQMPMQQMPMQQTPMMTGPANNNVMGNTNMGNWGTGNAGSGSPNPANSNMGAWNAGSGNWNTTSPNAGTDNTSSGNRNTGNTGGNWDTRNTGGGNRNATNPGTGTSNTGTGQNQSSTLPINQPAQVSPSTPLDIPPNSQMPVLFPESPQFSVPNNPLLPPGYQEILSYENIQYLNGFLRTQIGRNCEVQLLIGSNSLEIRRGRLIGVGINYILLLDLTTNNMMSCDYYAIKFVEFF